MARPKLSWNSRQRHLRELPFSARMLRNKPFRSIDDAEWETPADRLAGPKGWYLSGEWRNNAGWRLILFATAAEAEAMQRWIAESGIETRPAPAPHQGPQLAVAGAKPS